MAFKRNMRGRGKYVAQRAKKAGLDMGKDLFMSIKTLFGSTSAMISLVLVVVLAVTHLADKTDGAIHQWSISYPNNALLRFISQYIEKVTGLLTFVPVFLLIPSRALPWLVMIVVLTVIALLPGATFYQYSVMAFMTHMFVQVRLASSKMLMIAAFVGYVLFLHAHLSHLAHPSEHFAALARGASNIDVDPLANLMQRSPSLVKSASTNSLNSPIQQQQQQQQQQQPPMQQQPQRGSPLSMGGRM